MEVAGFPYFEVEFDKKGRLVDEEQAEELIAFVRDGEGDDLLVLSHGWNNDIAEARTLYRRLLEQIRAQVPQVLAEGGRELAVMAVFWPSKKFAEKELIPGGAAGVGEGGVTADDLIEQLDELEGAFEEEGADEALAEARELVELLDESPEAQRRFVEVLRSRLLPREQALADPETAAEVPDELFDLPGDEVLARLAEEPEGVGEIDFEAGGAADLDAGGAAGLGEFFGGIKEGARNFLNYLTYFTMKKRAGVIGAGGVHQMLGRLRQADPRVRLHLIGHSFGGRLVSAAAKGPDAAPALVVDSIALLQAAFSHFGFSDRWDPPRESPGFFRRVLAGPRVRGPLIITHTVNDRAVGIYYAIASRLADQVAAAIGDENDIFGGIGRNGALRTPEASAGELLAPGGAYQFAGGFVFNLKADPFIKNHGDVTGDAVAYAILSAVAAAG